MPTALITGITGQDGSYLAELLLSKGYRVLGGVSNHNFRRNNLPDQILEKVEILPIDVRKGKQIERAVESNGLDEVYNLAALTGGDSMSLNPLEIAQVNGLAVVKILEAIIKTNRKIKFCQASSREIFGESDISPQTESTTRKPRNAYGAAKLYADSMVEIYRRNEGLFACSVILYNHESPRRGLNFVSRRIARGAASIKLGFSRKLFLGNLDTMRDWGFAADYMNAMWKMLQHENAEDFIVATGRAHSVRDMCRVAFEHVGLDYREYIEHDISRFRTSEKISLIGNPSKANRLLNWNPEKSFTDLVKMMVDSELEHLQLNHRDSKNVL